MQILFNFLEVKFVDIEIAHNSKKKYIEQRNNLNSRLTLLNAKPENSDEKLLLFVFYAGHGVIRQEHTNIMFNEEKESDRFENLE